MHQKSEKKMQKQLHKVTHRRKAEEDDLKLFRYLIDQTNDAIFVIEPETGCFLDINARACSNLGYERKELLKMCITDIETLIPDISSWKARVDEVRKTGHAVREGRQRRKDGTTLPVEVNANYISRERRDYLVTVARDITERKKAEEELRNALKRVEDEKARSESIIAAIGEGISIQDRDFKIIYQNQIQKDLIGDHVGEHCYRAYEKMDATCEGCPVAMSFKDGGIHTVERAVPTDKGVTYVEITTSALRDSKGKIIAGIEMIRDITKRKKTEETVKLLNRQIELILKSAGEGIYGLDLNGSATFINPAAARMIGWEAAEVIGRRLHDVLHHSNPDGSPYPAEDCPIYAALKDGAVHHVTNEVFWRKDGTNFPVEYTSTPIVEDGTFSGAVVVFRDITERKRSEERISRQIQKLSSLRAIDLAITSSLDVRMTLNVFIEHVVTRLGVDAACVLLLNPRTRILEYAAGQGFRTSALRHSHLRIGEGYAGVAVLENRIVSVPDLGAEDSGFKRLGLLEGEDFVTYYGVPLLAKGHVKGVLEIFHRSPLQPDEEWFEFLDGLAMQAAIAIDNNSLFYELERSNMDLALAYDSTIEGWSRALDYRDKETEGHSRRVTELTIKIAREMGMSEDELVLVRRGALLHDIGKMRIPDDILLKPGPLTEQEWEIMRRHPVYSYELLYPIGYLRSSLDIPYCHHEKWDGNGYPRGLKGEQIPLCARIFSVVDVWDALCSDRPYRPAWSEEKAKEHILSLSGVQFDPHVVEMFMKAISEKKD
jgi:PAS domain S-box-containing protein/putative nucleotidyltransferase with HDIG domain